ncbi:CpaF family protein [Syntrophorhabdus aromaticivorans]|uniref:CpaF family protein n=1 Tax=Syntrophorhabdus aromaticivorans TaxID=328301 RepID=A0A971M789_9BACT|nr:CpaF family protein [Syntrophorhabdus aromaticivorans]NLW36486.1 CpaF family protein [Syntrophorhabdus aromaticivorans]
MKKIFDTGGRKFTLTNEYNDLKTKVHEMLLDMIDLTLIGTLDKTLLRNEIRRVIENILANDGFNVPLNFDEKEMLCKEVEDEVMGLGPIEPFMHDPTVTDILVNTYRQVYVERYGKLYLTSARFRDDIHLKKIIDRIVSAVGRRIDESSPMVDARLADGSRVNAIVPPLAIDGPSLSIRRFAVDPLELEDLVTLRTVTEEIGELIKGIVASRLNVLISGGTGTGKTTLLNVFSRFIPANERIITIEDSAELQLKQEHVVRLETRPANIEGKGEITQRDLVRNSLRMRPDRIIVGEVRSGEVLDMLQAMNTGHDGSLTTIHANSPRDALLRLETLVAMSGLNIPNDAVRRYVASAIDVIVHLQRLMDGTRKIVSLQEIVGMEGNVITMQEIFFFEQTGIDKEGKVKGRFRITGIMPKFAERFRAKGIAIPPGLLDGSRVMEI